MKMSPSLPHQKRKLIYEDWLSSGKTQKVLSIEHGCTEGQVAIALKEIIKLKPCRPSQSTENS